MLINKKNILAVFSGIIDWQLANFCGVRSPAQLYLLDMRTLQSLQ